MSLDVCEDYPMCDHDECELLAQEHDLKSLRSQITQLQAEAVENAVLVEKQRRALGSAAVFLKYMPDKFKDNFDEVYANPLSFVRQAGTQSPPQGFGKAVLDVVRPAVKRDEVARRALKAAMGHGPESDSDAFYAADDDMDHAIAALTPEYKTWLGVE